MLKIGVFAILECPIMFVIKNVWNVDLKDVLHAWDTTIWTDYNVLVVHLDPLLLLSKRTHAMTATKTVSHAL
jgi:hypothetical protein